jgi:hypothetical protein
LTKLEKKDSSEILEKKMKIYLKLTKKLLELNKEAESENLLESKQLLFDNLRKEIENKPP